MKYGFQKFLRSNNSLTIERSMTSGPIWKQILFFSIPILLSNVFQQLYNAVDSVVVGQYIGYQALAAVGANNSIINVLVSVFLGFSVGSGIIISQYYGAKDYENVSRASHSAMILGLICAAILTVSGYFLSRPILILMNTPADVLELSVTYLQIFFIGITATVIYNTGSAILRSVGYSLSPFIYLFIGCILNIVLDFVFVAVLNMGVAGAAWATVISQAVSALLVVIQLFLTRSPIRLSLKKFCFDLKITKRIILMGFPAGIQTSMYSIGNVLVQTSLNSFGSVAMAGFVSASKLDNFTYAPVQAFGLAVNTFVGQNVGAKEYERVKSGTYIALFMSLVTAVIMAVPMLIWSKELLSLFGRDEQVLSFGAEMMKFIIPFYTVFSVCEVLSGTLKGAGKTFTSAVLTFIGILLIRILWLYLVVYFVHDIRLLYSVYPVSWVVTALIYLVYYWAKRWKGILNPDRDLLKVNIFKK